jgi:hypothetical protein
MGPVSVSRNIANGLLYKRHQQYLQEEREEFFPDNGA